MIVTLAGRRIDAQNAEVARFPLKQSAIVRKRIRALLIEQGATTLVSSAACGADLLALDVAGELGIRRRIILPFEAGRFRALSVIDRPGEWGALFDRIIDEVRAKEDLVLLHERKKSEIKFTHTNTYIINEALSLAHSNLLERGKMIPNKIIAVIVWEGKAHGNNDTTVSFVNEANIRSIPVIEVLTC